MPDNASRHIIKRFVLCTHLHICRMIMACASHIMYHCMVPHSRVYTSTERERERRGEEERREERGERKRGREEERREERERERERARASTGPTLHIYGVPQLLHDEVHEDTLDDEGPA